MPRRSAVTGRISAGSIGPSGKLHGCRRAEARGARGSARPTTRCRCTASALSLGGAERLDPDHLRAFRELVDRFDPELVSEHIAWSAHDGIWFADLLPPSLSRSGMDRLCDNVDEMQEALGRPVLIENPASYLVLPDREMNEVAFVAGNGKTDRLRPPGRRQQHLRQRRKYRAGRGHLCRRGPGRPDRGNSSCRLHGRRGLRRASADRQPRRGGRRRGLASLRPADRPHRSAADIG